MSKKKLITVIGPIASGKTTVSRIIAEELKIPLLDADLFEENPFLAPFVKNKKRWSFAVELFFTIKRFKKLYQLGKLLKKSSVVVDSGIIMAQIYSKNQLVQGHMTAAEWKFFTEIIDDYKRRLPEPDVIVYLKASPQSQLKRIEKRGRSFEAGYTLEYLRQITDRIKEYIEGIDPESETSLIAFDTDKYNPNGPKGKKELLKDLKQRLK